MPAFDILVAGEINPDLILCGDVVPAFGQVEKLVESAVLTVGSSSAIFACGAARLGLKVAFMGVCGDDLWGRFMLAEMSKRGVDTSHVIVSAGRNTGLSVILARPSDRAILTYPGEMNMLEARHISDDLLSSARHLHVGSFFLQTGLQPGLSVLFLRAHALEMTISLDPNWAPSGDWQRLAALLPQVDVFLPNENELFAITQTKDQETALRSIREKCGLTAVKCGARGAVGIQGSETIQLPSLPADPVDTVGAGDSFDAGFLVGYLQGWALKDSLQLAIVCGSLSTRAAGGTAAQPTLAEAIQYVRQPG